MNDEMSTNEAQHEQPARAMAPQAGTRTSVAQDDDVESGDLERAAAAGLQTDPGHAVFDMAIGGAARGPTDEEKAAEMEPGQPR